MEICWPGGYFGFPGRRADMSSLTDDQLRSNWRKEYLPGPTTLVATAICGSVAGLVRTLQPNASHYRITLHRLLVLPGEQLLQQACEYVGHGLLPSAPTAGRTFPAENAMIGLAFTHKTAVRTIPGVSEDALGRAMDDLALHEAARTNAKARFILALPVLQLDGLHRVIGVLYLDSRDPEFYLSDAETLKVRDVLQNSIEQLALFSARATVGIRNIRYDAPDAIPVQALKITNAVSAAVTLLPSELSVSIDEEFMLNFDYADPAATPFPNAR
jgi:hypothetical protein